MIPHLSFWIKTDCRDVFFLIFLFVFLYRVNTYINIYTGQEFRRIVLCHQLWLKTEADEIQKDKNYVGHK